jgi:ATP-dependent DNA ligase
MEGSKQSFFDRLKDATGVVMERTREGIEDLQTRQALSRAYNDLGRTTAELVEKGEVAHPKLAEAVEEIKKLKAELEAEGVSAEPADEPAAQEPPPPAG